MPTPWRNTLDRVFEEIESTNSQEVLDSLIMDGDLYGVPFTTNTWFMYYDKSVFSEEDVKNLDTMLEKGVVSFPFVNSWYLPAFYIGNGCTLFGDGTDESAGVDFAGEKAVDVTNYLIDLESNPNFRIDDLGSVSPDFVTEVSMPCLRVPGTPMPSRRFWEMTWVLRLFPHSL